MVTGLLLDLGHGSIGNAESVGEIYSLSKRNMNRYINAYNVGIERLNERDKV